MLRPFALCNRLELNLFLTHYDDLLNRTLVISLSVCSIFSILAILANQKLVELARKDDEVNPRQKEVTMASFRNLALIRFSQ